MQKHLDLFYQLLHSDELRGDDATGLIYIENDSGFGILKDAVPASWCADSMIRHNLLTDRIRKGKALIGHNRKATMGRVVAETSHPFVVDKTFAMVHNGTLRGHKKLKETEVDSEALAHLLEPVLKSGVSKEELEEQMGKIDGAYAVSAYSQSENSMFLLRNGERPLSLLELPDCWLFASESGLLLWIAGRNGYDLAKASLKPLKEHVIYTVDLKTNAIVEQEYTPKKALPPVIPALGTGVHTVWKKMKTTITHSETLVSKNGLKRLKSRFLGKVHSFFVDDWVEARFPKTLADGETSVLLMGECDAEVFSGVPHTIHAVIDIPEVFPETIPEDFSTELYYGTVYDITMDKSLGEYRFHMTKVKPLHKTDITKTMDKVLETTKGTWDATTPIVH